MKKRHKKFTLKEILPKYTVDDIIDEEGEAAAVDEVMTDIDRRLDRLEKYIERKLTSKEEQAVLHIVHEKSMKDDEGYISLFFSFIQAWKIYQAKKTATMSRARRLK